MRPIWIILLGLTACTGSKSPAEPALDPSARFERIEWKDDPELLGVSGATTRKPGEIWVAPERTRKIVTISMEGTKLGPPHTRDLVGLKRGQDVESITFLDNNHLLLGTESRGQRTEDPIYVARIDEKSVTIERSLTFDYTIFDMKASNNQGVEGLCSAGQFAVAASEVVQKKDSKRVALVGVFTFPDAKFAPHRIELTTDQGKLSALACHIVEGQLVVFAIERHFGIMRLVRFTLNTKGTPEEGKAVLVRNLSPDLKNNPLNFEGIAWVSPNKLLIVTDNFYRRKMGGPAAYTLELAPSTVSSL